MTLYGQSAPDAAVLIVDNYDSFTRNLTALVADCGVRFTIVKNDRVTGADVLAHSFILISPGPGVPHEAGRTCELIREFSPSRSILGVCLGHQAIAEVFGGALVRLAAPDHGVSREVMTTAEPCRLFGGLPERFGAGFYHSWEVSPESVPGDLAVTAVSNEGAVMALSHRRYDVHGVQFHPESVMTPHGRRIIGNWLGVQPLSSTVNSGSSGRFES
jgi:anthranilate synthase component 2